MILPKQRVRKKRRSDAQLFVSILINKEKVILNTLVKRAWQNLIQRQFKNEGEAIPDRKTGYVPWKERSRSPSLDYLAENEIVTNKVKQVSGKKVRYQELGRPLLELTYPTLLTRYKRNVNFRRDSDGEYTLSVDFPRLISGGGTADAGVHQFGAERKTVSQGLPTTGLPQRKLNVDSFRTVALSTTVKYINEAQIARTVVSIIKDNLNNN